LHFENFENIKTQLKMKSIEETALEKFPQVIEQDGYDINEEGRDAYIEGAKDVLDEFMRTISVSTEKYLHDNLLKIINMLNEKSKK
jgi:hypothetical protein